MNEIPTEHQEQKALIRWWSENINHLIFAIPNGDKRSISVAKRLKLEGVTAGIPDLFCPALNLWIEMKKIKGGVVSDEQKEIIEYLKDIGYSVIIGRGAKDAINQLTELLKGQ